MTGAKHTPGPWKVEGSIYKHMHSEIASAMPGAERGIAQVWKHEDAMADARLIAAAPELSSKLEEVADFLLANFGQVGDPDNPRAWSDEDAFALYVDARATLAKAGVS